MSDRPWWGHVLQWGLWVVIMLVITGWLARARKPTSVGADDVLSHPRSTLILGMIGTAFFGGLLTACLMFAKPHEWWTIPLFALFTGWAVVLVREAIMVRHRLTSAGIEYRGVFAVHQIVRWDQIRGAKWSDSMKWLVLSTADGRRLRFSVLLRGLDVLARRLREHVPNLVEDDSTAKVLNDAAKGELPSIWM